MTPADIALAELTAKGAEGGRAVTRTWAQQHAPKIRYTHDAMIDLVIENPAISQNEIAALFGYSPAWVSTVFTSDAFKAKLEQRREELVDPVLRMTLREKIEGLAQQSLKILMEKVSKPEGEVPPAVALKSLELATRALGIGGNAPQQTVVISSEERIAGLAHRLMALKGTPPPSGQVIDI